MSTDLKETRSYSIKLLPTPQVAGLLESTHAIYNRGADAFLGFFLDLIGSTLPTASPVEFTAKSDDEESDQTEVLSAEAQCFMSWFTCEIKTEADFIISADEVVPRFKKYWSLNEGGPLDDDLPKTLFDSVGAESKRKNKDQNDEVVWVDRYASLRARLRSSGLKLHEVVSLCSLWGFPLTLDGDTKTDADQLARSILSNLFGDDERKADWAYVEQRSVKLSEALESILAHPEKFRSTRTVAQVCFRALGIPDQPTAKEIETVFRAKKAGAPEAAERVLKSYAFEPKTFNKEQVAALERLLKGVKSKIVRAQQADVVTSIARKVRRRILRSIEAATGVSYVDERRRRTDEFGAMATLALARLKSYRSNNIRQAFIRLATYRDLKNEIGMVNSSPVFNQVSKLVDAVKRQNSEQPYIYRRQLRGIDRVLKLAEKNLPLDAIKLAREQDDEAFGDGNLLQQIAASVPENAFVNALNFLELIAKIDRLREQYTNRKHFAICHFGQKPDHPWFGNVSSSKPFATIIRPDIGSYDFLVTFNVFDGDTVRQVKCPAAGKRLRKEIFNRNPDAEEGARDHVLVRTMLGCAVRSTADTSSLAIQLSNDLRANVSVELTRLAIPKVKDLREAESLRILSFDIGQRDAIAFSLIDTKKKKSSITLRSQRARSNRTVNVSFVSDGFVKDEQTLYRGRKVTVCRLEGVSRDATDGEKEFFRSLKISWKGKESSPPKDLRELNFRISSFALYWVKKQVREEKGLTAVAKLKKIYDYFFESHEFIPGDANRKKGGLSFRRIETFDNLRRAFASLIDVYKNENLEVPEWLTKIHAHLLVRNRGRKRERARVTVSRALRLALSEAVDVIAIESRTAGSKALFTTSQTQTKRGNRKNSNWLPRYVLRELESQAKLYGIFVKRVSAGGTSMRDHAMAGSSTYEDKSTFGTRLALRQSVQNLAALIGRCYSSKGWRAEIAQRWYDAQAERFGTDDPALLAKKLIEARVKYVADTYGKFYESRKGVIDADYNAARNIGIGAVRSLYELYAKKKPARDKVSDETVETAR